MGFALWIDGDLAWAEGLHEYRRMGVAVISATDRFRPRDFERRRPAGTGSRRAKKHPQCKVGQDSSPAADVHVGLVR